MILGQADGGVRPAAGGLGKANAGKNADLSACAQCGYPAAKLRSYNWGLKAKRRKTTLVPPSCH
jgi:hypothetical protein